MIIGLTGRAGSGKSECAHFLQRRYGLEICKFAAPLKSMLYALGLNAREIEGDLKQEPCNLLGGKTPRHAMQTLGTEWGRDLIDSDLWTNAWLRGLPSDRSAVADDVRFPNEAALVRRLGGKVIEIVRPDLEPIPGEHPSETRDFGVDVTVANDSDLDAMFSRLDVALMQGVAA
ncbi:MAG: deoxynucleotide monophosphate kinase [Pseudomonadota bacterium]